MHTFSDEFRVYGLPICEEASMVALEERVCHWNVIDYIDNTMCSF